MAPASFYSTSAVLYFDPSAWVYKGHLRSLWPGSSALLLCRRRQWLLCQVVVVGVT